MKLYSYDFRFCINDQKETIIMWDKIKLKADKL